MVEFPNVAMTEDGEMSHDLRSAGSVRQHRFERRARIEIDIVRADAEYRSQFAHLRDVWRATPALPEINRLRLNAYSERELELRPAMLKP
jgi:hypothetical protein